MSIFGGRSFSVVCGIETMERVGCCYTMIWIDETEEGVGLYVKSKDKLTHTQGSLCIAPPSDRITHYTLMHQPAAAVQA
jgi:hypothetical protein